MKKNFTDSKAEDTPCESASGRALHIHLYINTDKYILFEFESLAYHIIFGCLLDVILYILLIETARGGLRI